MRHCRTLFTLEVSNNPASRLRKNPKALANNQREPRERRRIERDTETRCPMTMTSQMKNTRSSVAYGHQFSVDEYLRTPVADNHQPPFPRSPVEAERLHLHADVRPGLAP